MIAHLNTSRSNLLSDDFSVFSNLELIYIEKINDREVV